MLAGDKATPEARECKKSMPFCKLAIKLGLIKEHYRILIAFLTFHCPESNIVLSFYFKFIYVRINIVLRVYHSKRKHRYIGCLSSGMKISSSL